MARRISVEIVGNAASLERTFSRAGHSATAFHRDLGKATRGALSGSGVFHHLGRSLAFASGGFLAFATAGEALRSTVDAAVDAATTQRQLATQLKASGLSYKQYRGEIDQTNLHLSALSGFTKDELDKGFTTIVRSTGNVGKALKDTALAADIARGKHMDLAAAAKIVAKVEAGNTGILRRQGIQIPKNATVEEALAIARRKFAGQAAAGATAQQKFAATLHDTEVIIGTALLPTLNNLLTRATVWLSKMNESGRLQRDVASATHVLGGALRGVEAIVIPVAHAFRGFSHAVGGSKHAIEILGVAFASWKIAGMLAKLAELTGAFAGLAAAEGAAGAGGGAIGKLGKASKLARFGKFLPLLGEAALPIGAFAALAYASRERGNIKVTHRTGSGQNIGVVTNDTGSLKAGTQVLMTPRGPIALSKLGIAGDTATRALGPIRRGIDSPLRYFPPTTHTAAAAAASAVPRPLSLMGQFNIDELKLADAQRGRNTKLQRQLLVSELALTLKLEAQAKTLKDRTALAQQAAGLQGQIDGIDQEALSKKKDAAEKAKAARDLARQFAVPMKLQLAQAKADALAAGGSSDLTKGQMSAAKAIRTAALKAIHSHRLSLQGLIDAWNTVSSVNSQLQSQTAGKGLAKTYHHASTAALTAGLNLSRDQVVAIREREAQRNAHRGLVPSGPAVLGEPISITGGVHLHGVQNVDQLAAALAKHAKSKHQRRGTRR